MATGIVSAVRSSTLYLGIGARVLWRMRKLRPTGTFTAADLIEQWAASTPNKVAIRFEGRSVTYAELNAAGNRYANWAQGIGVRRGDVVALLMENRPEYVACWLGLAKLGAIAALINTNLTGASLAHCLRVSKAKHLVLGAELREAWHSAREDLEEEPHIWLARNGAETPGELESHWSDLDAVLAESSPEAGRDLR